MSSHRIVFIFFFCFLKFFFVFLIYYASTPNNDFILSLFIPFYLFFHLFFSFINLNFFLLFAVILFIRDIYLPSNFNFLTFTTFMKIAAPSSDSDLVPPLQRCASASAAISYTAHQITPRCASAQSFSSTSLSTPFVTPDSAPSDSIVYVNSSSVQDGIDYLHSFRHPNIIRLLGTYVMYALYVLYVLYVLYTDVTCVVCTFILLDFAFEFA